MTPERWQTIDRLFNEVAEIPLARREDFLAEKCGTDDDLLREVQSLLKAHEQADEFMETSAMKVVAKDLAREKTIHSNFLGKTLGHYKIEKLIGEGGMGVVYLAFDEKLQREVAIKILPDDYASNDERVNHIEREARAISALNHPNIVTIYDVGVFENTNYIATEFVNGRTLRHYVVKGMDLRGVLNVIIQCCDALAAAHNAGIVHRDIKPENILVRPDGYVKILDFGLAKLTEVSAVNQKGFDGKTGGMIIGTPAYMSPEQLAGKQIDRRTDLWSIGLVLYELVTGINPFKKKTKHETFEAILSSDPPRASSLNSEAFFELDRVLTKTLQKNADLSYQSAAELRSDLMNIKHDIDSVSSQGNSLNGLTSNPQRKRLARYLGAAILIIFTVFAGGLTLYFYSSKNASIEAEWKKAKNIQLTSQAGRETFPHLSADGESFIFAANTNGNYDIFLQRVGGKNSINLTEDSFNNDTQPSFSPDGKLIAFRSERDGGGIFVMEETGENPRRVSDFGFYPDWSPDGQYLAVDEKGYDRPEVRGLSSIWIINAENGEKRKLVGDRAYQPVWSPDGERIAFWFVGEKDSQRNIATVSVEGGEPVPVASSANTNWNPVWSPDGRYLYYASDQTGNMAFWRIRIDQSTGKTSGEAEIVPTPAKFNSHLSFSKDGKRLIYVQSIIQSNLRSVEFDPQNEKLKAEVVSITSGDYEVRRPRLSPDGRHFVFDLAGQTQEDIVVIDRNGMNWRNLTDDKYFERYPVWSPDGKNIAFTSDRGGSHNIWMMNADGSNLRQITFDPQSVTIPVWSPDGRRIISRRGRIGYVILEFDGANNLTQTEIPMEKDFFYGNWDWSPDGKKIAGKWNDDETGESGIGYFSMENNEYVKLWTGESGMPHWLPDSRRLIFPVYGGLFVMDLETRGLRIILNLPRQSIAGVGLSRDGDLLYFTVRSAESNICLLDLR